MLAALLNDRTLGTRTRSASAELPQAQPETVAEGGAGPGHRHGGGREAGIARWQASPARPRRLSSSKTPSLDQFTLDLTALAAQGKIDPVIGPEWEIRQVIDILTRGGRTIRS